MSTNYMPEVVTNFACFEQDVKPWLLQQLETRTTRRALRLAECASPT